MRFGLHLVFFLISAAAFSLAAPAKSLVRFDPNDTNLLKPTLFKPYEKGFTRDNNTFICDNANTPATRGATQTVTLNQTTPQPILASAYSKAENVSGSKDPDYSLYLDLTFTDGSHLWGQSAPFDTGSHDWQTRAVRVLPPKPIQSVSFYLLFRHHLGKASFKDPRLIQLNLPNGALPFDGLAVSPTPPATGFAVRDVAADSDFIPFENGQALGLKLESQSSPTTRPTFISAHLTNTTGKDRAITLVYTLALPNANYLWLPGPRSSEPAQSPRDYHALSSGRLSRYPLAAVASPDIGHAIILDMLQPAVFRVGFSAATSELYIAYDLALTTEKPSAHIRFATTTFTPAWGFRAAIASMYDAFPDYFHSRTPRQGAWMPFYSISKVQNHEDFGFAFKEGNDETAWDDAHNISTFRYTEPLTWWMSMPKNMPRTLEAALAHAKALADKGDKNALALLATGYHDQNANFPARLLDTPWSNGAVWSMNSSPHLPGNVTDFQNKWNPTLKSQLYGPNRKADLDGEYIDSAEGYVTDQYNFRREHFTHAQTPLTFDPDSLKPAIYRGLIAFEYVRAISSDLHTINKLVMANSTPNSLCFLTPLLDVMGTETDWNPANRWQPMTDDELLYRRVLCGPKPYCFLMNTNFDNFSYNLTEKFMKRCLAYGMFPGFFSADASTGHYFSRPELYNRDRPLFKKYLPLCKLLAQSGWQPVTLAHSNNNKILLERFGRNYLTVFNDSQQTQTAAITLQSLAPRGQNDLLHHLPLNWQNNRVNLTLDPEDLLVLEIQ